VQNIVRGCQFVIRLPLAEAGARQQTAPIVVDPDYVPQAG
jgi:hypothetical protein